mgnify:FL=1
MESNVFKLSNAGGMSSRTRYWSMLAGNTTWVPFTPSGSFESIATVTVGAGGSATIDFTSIASTYQHLQIRVIARDTYAASDTDFSLMRFNSDSSSNYARHYLYGNGSSAAAGGASSVTSSYAALSAHGNSLASTFAGSVIDILDYASTSKYKTIRVLGGVDFNGSGQVHLASSLWQSTNAITSISIFPNPSSNFAQYSVAALYGVK